MPSPERRLKELGITLPKPAKPVANYVGFVRTGNLIYVSGQVPVADGKVMVTGLLGRDVSVEEGAKAARQCAINIIAQLNEAVAGDLTRIARIGHARDRRSIRTSPATPKRRFLAPFKL